MGYLSFHFLLLSLFLTLFMLCVASPSHYSILLVIFFRKSVVVLSSVSFFLLDVNIFVSFLFFISKN
jgi:hypothetical protein